MLMYFESIENAKTRARNEQELVKSGAKRRKNHVGQLGSFEFDIDSCIENVSLIIFFRIIIFWYELDEYICR